MFAAMAKRNTPKPGAVLTDNVRTPKEVVHGINVHLTLWCITMVHETNETRWLFLGAPWVNAEVEKGYQALPKAKVDSQPTLFEL